MKLWLVNIEGYSPAIFDSLERAKNYVSSLIKQFGDRVEGHIEERTINNGNEGVIACQFHDSAFWTRQNTPE